MSPLVPCTYCGLPVRVSRVEPGQPVYCCVGCAIASHIPVDDKGGYPVTRELVLAVVLGFVLFNQFMAWLLSLAFSHDAAAGGAEVAYWVSLGLGIITWAGLLAAGGIARTQRLVDVWLASVVLVLGGLSVVTHHPACFAFGNLALALWHARGFLKSKTRQKPDLRV